MDRDFQGSWLVRGSEFIFSGEEFIDVDLSCKSLPQSGFFPQNGGR